MKAVQKQLIEKCGGLEAAQRVVDGAPDGTNLYHPLLGVYCRNGFGGCLDKFDIEEGFIETRLSRKSLIKLSDLRSAITAQRELESLPEYPNCKGFSQGVRMEEGYCADCGGHSTDPIHAPKVISTDRMPELQRDAALNILHDDLQKRIDAALAKIDNYSGNDYDVDNVWSLVYEVRETLKGESL